MRRRSKRTCGRLLRVVAERYRADDVKHAGAVAGISVRLATREHRLMSGWSSRFHATGRAWAVTDGQRFELSNLNPVTICEHERPRPGLGIDAADHRSGVGLTFDTIETPRVTRIDVTVPSGDHGNSTWGLLLSEPLAWLPQEHGQNDTTAVSGEHTYRIISHVQDGRWTLSAGPLAASAEWLTSLHLSLYADRVRWPWEAVTISLRHSASTVGLNLDLTLRVAE